MYRLGVMGESRNKYVDFISDKEFLACLDRLYKKYEAKKKGYTLTQFMKNKVDPIKLISDMKINGWSEEEVIYAEINRQIDKTISNHIGHFQEELLGEIKGFEHKRASGYDIRSMDNKLFAEIKNKENTVNSTSKEGTYQKLEAFAIKHPTARCYWVSLIANSSYHQQWVHDTKTKSYCHPNVYKISGDKFYELLTGDPEAFSKVIKAYPIALDDYLQDKEVKARENDNAVYRELKKRAEANQISLMEQLSNENFSIYKGFPLK